MGLNAPAVTSTSSILTPLFLMSFFVICCSCYHLAAMSTVTTVAAFYYAHSALNFIVSSCSTKLCRKRANGFTARFPCSPSTAHTYPQFAAHSCCCVLKLPPVLNNSVRSHSSAAPLIWLGLPSFAAAGPAPLGFYYYILYFIKSLQLCCNCNMPLPFAFYNWVAVVAVVAVAATAMHCHLFASLHQLVTLK